MKTGRKAALLHGSRQALRPPSVRPGATDLLKQEEADSDVDPASGRNGIMPETELTASDDAADDASDGGANPMSTTFATLSDLNNLNVFRSQETT